MISKIDVQKMAKVEAVNPTTIEKDYVLGLILDGINKHSVLSQFLVFKGGTCIKKCYLEKYRFSEDLDFSVKGAFIRNEEEFKRYFYEIAQYLKETYNLIVLDNIKFSKPRYYESLVGKINYKGPLDGNSSYASKVKIDITWNEPIILDSQIREINHPYSDKLSNGIHIEAYALEEVIAEKMRALLDRTQARDLYDIVQFYERRDKIKPDMDLFYNTLVEKCLFKKLPLPSIQMIKEPNRLKELKDQWKGQLEHQLPKEGLKPVEYFLNILDAVFEWMKLR